MRRLLLVLGIFAIPSLLWAGPTKPPISLAGDPAVEIWQNWHADEMNAIKISSAFEFEYLKSTEYLVPIPDSVCIDMRLFPEWRYVMPQVVRFITTIQEKMDARFGEPCAFTGSGARTIDKQWEIILGTGTKENGNDKPNGGAAKPDGPRASLHLRGIAVDISKKKLPKVVVTWLRDYLQSVEDGSHIDVTEEWSNEVFHIVVFPDDAIRPIIND